MAGWRTPCASRNLSSVSQLFAQPLWTLYPSKGFPCTWLHFTWPVAFHVPFKPASVPVCHPHKAAEAIHTLISPLPSNSSPNLWAQDAKFFFPYVLKVLGNWWQERTGGGGSGGSMSRWNANESQLTQCWSLPIDKAHMKHDGTGRVAGHE